MQCIYNDFYIIVNFLRVYIDIPISLDALYIKIEMDVVDDLVAKYLSSEEQSSADVTANQSDDVNNHIHNTSSSSLYIPGKITNSLKTIPLRLTQTCLVNKPFFLHVSDKYPRSLINTLDSIRKSEQLCDVTIRVGAKTFNAHKLILSACCPYFRAMFTQEMAESRQKEVTIQDVDEHAMELLIDFAYTAVIKIDETNVQTILPAACILQLQEIQAACCEFLKKQLDPSNCLGIKFFADTHACSDLLHVSELYTLHNFQDVVESEEFLLLSTEELCEIISSDELNVITEEDVFVSVMKWVRFNISERKDKLKEVLKHVRLPLLSAKFLVGVVSPDLLIRYDENCRELVDEAKNYLLLPEQRNLMQGSRFKPRQPTKRGEVLFAVGGWCTGDAINSVERYEFLYFFFTSCFQHVK